LRRNGENHSKLNCTNSGSNEPGRRKKEVSFNFFGKKKTITPSGGRTRKNDENIAGKGGKKLTKKGRQANVGEKDKTFSSVAKRGGK